MQWDCLHAIITAREMQYSRLSPYDYHLTGLADSHEVILECIMTDMPVGSRAKLDQ